MSPIDIVILTYNRFNYLQRTINSLINNTKYPYRLTVVDNKSTDIRVKEYLEGLKKKENLQELVINSENMILAGWRAGLSRVRSEYFAISDPDILVPKLKPCWLTQLVELLSKFPRIARIGLSLDPSNVPSCWTRSQAKRLSFKTGPYFNREHGLRIIDTDTTMQLIRTESFREAGGFSVPELNMDFWKKFHRYGLSVTSQNITAKHLGWNEYKEEPEYLVEKTKRIRDYPEKDLISRNI